MTDGTLLEQMSHENYNGRILVRPALFGWWWWQLAYDCPTGTYGRSLPKSKRGLSQSLGKALTAAKVTADRLGMPLPGWR